MKKKMLNILITLSVIYIAVCILLYLFQEKLLFHPERLADTYTFSFDNNFEEVWIPTADNGTLHGVLFKTAQPKGLIFYLHGNAGSVSSWGYVAPLYLSQGYDVFIPDYRGYGKSTGSINSQEQVYNDVQTAYAVMKTRYNEDRIIILGYSIGSGPAAWLASQHHPRLLILQAPYYSMSDLVKHKMRFVPEYILKYKFTTNKYLERCSMPVVIFHGNKDEVIYYGSSLKLENEFKNGDRLVTLNGQGHNGITDNRQYREEMVSILAD